jgi:serine/threonine protein kinase
MDRVRAGRFETELKGRDIGEWTVGPLIDNGASAAVFEADSKGQKVALKIFDPELVERVGESSQLARIDTEVSLVGKHYEHLVEIYGGGRCTETGLYFVAMEMLRLPKLSTLIQSFPADKIRSILAQLAGAARFLEKLDLVHRDIKPDNIVVAEDLSRAVLLDLGVLRPLDPSKQEDRGSGDHFLATTRYSSPEYLFRVEENSQAGWRALTFYQLGGVAHDMIMRRPLFDGFGPPQARLVDAVHNQIPVIDNPEVPVDLQQLARNCLQKDWRVRSALVAWDDFSPNPPKAYDLEAAKERIRKRFTAATISATDSDEKDLQTTGRLIQTLIHQITASIREIRQKAGVLPPLKITLAFGESGRPSRIRIDMLPSERYALKLPLVVLLQMELIDEATGALRLMATAAAGEVTTEAPSEAAWKVVFAGTPDPRILMERLEGLLYSAFDQAQMCINPSVLELSFSSRE